MMTRQPLFFLLFLMFTDSTFSNCGLSNIWPIDRLFNKIKPGPDFSLLSFVGVGPDSRSVLLFYVILFITLISIFLAERRLE